MSSRNATFRDIMDGTVDPGSLSVTELIDVYRTLGNKVNQEIFAALIQKYPIESSSVASSSTPLTAFGEVNSAEKTPVIQSAPVNNYLPANFRAFTSGTGTAGVEDTEFSVTTGVGVGGYGAVQSFRSTDYKSGQGGSATISARFPTGGVADSWQGAGLITIADEISFGYNGVDFGVWHRYGGLAEIQVLQVTTPAAGAETATIEVNGVSIPVSLTSGTVQHNAREIADEFTANLAGWHATQIDDTVVIVALSDGAKAGAYSFSSTGAAIGAWSQTTAGVTKTSDFVAQTDWNVNTMPGLDPTFGNVYQIIYKYGYGSIIFSVENPSTGQFEVVHIIQYTNTNSAPSLTNPSLHLGIYVVSLGSTTDITVRAASLASFIQGKRERTRNDRSFKSTKSIGTTETNIFTLQNRRSVNGRINQADILPDFISVTNEANKGATFRILGNATIDGYPNFQYAGSQNLVSLVDEAGGEVLSPGRQLFSVNVAPGTTRDIDLTPIKLVAPPTLRLTFSGQVNSGGASGDLSVTSSWYEDV